MDDRSKHSCIFHGCLHLTLLIKLRSRTSRIHCMEGELSHPVKDDILVAPNTQFHAPTRMAVCKFAVLVTTCESDGLVAFATRPCARFYASARALWHLLSSVGVQFWALGVGVRDVAVRLTDTSIAEFDPLRRASS